jgi:hypothetical protein
VQVVVGVAPATEQVTLLLVYGAEAVSVTVDEPLDEAIEKDSWPAKVENPVQV